MWVLQADKLASSAGGGFSFFGGKGDKLEQAAEAYSQAANAFRIANQGSLHSHTNYRNPQLTKHLTFPPGKKATKPAKLSRRPRQSRRKSTKKTMPRTAS